MQPDNSFLKLDTINVIFSDFEVIDNRHVLKAKQNILFWGGGGERGVLD